ncbi:MAG: restriction endonuclease subunit S [Acidimicrobiaceae bacterium]|nr:restriction endonuclease subunit S [Acidimicrobiaceae bacterium]
MRPPYPHYRDSGVEWLGDVPEHWRDTFVKYCYDIQLGKMLQPEPFGSHEFETPYLKALNVQWHHINIEEPPTMWASDDDLERFGVSQGDLLVCEGGEGGRAAMLDKTLDGWIIQNALHRVRAKSHSENRFLMYWLTALAASGWLEAINNRATIAHFTKEKFGALPLLLPPLSEQRAIAEFLGRETGEIDRLVAKKRLLIERLGEYRTALTTRTVTRGLPPDVASAAGFDPSPRLKSSGVEWLGDVPEDWEVGETQLWFDIVNGGTPASGVAEYWDGDTVWITPDDLGRNSGNWINESRRTITNKGVQNSSAQTNPVGSIILSTRAPIGHIAITAVPAATNQGCRTLVPHPKTDSCFSYYALLSSRPVIQSLGKGSTFTELASTELGSHPIPHPPLDEQRAIAEFLDRETGKIDKLCSRVEIAIERLLEYRAALITAAVTGKIDVRDSVETAARVPGVRGRGV